jgi:hypothetical protein
MKQSELKRRAPMKTRRAPISPASIEQREKIKGRACVNCAQGPCDPAHLVPRGLGGCDHPDCVLPLCRNCHDRLDGRAPRSGLDLSPVLALRDFAAERSHMASHWSFPVCLERLSGERWMSVERVV